MTWQVEKQCSESIEESENSTSEATWRIFSETPGTAEEARAAFIGAVNPRELRDLFGGKSVRCRVEHEDGSGGRCYLATLSFAGDNGQTEQLKQGKAYWCDTFNTMGGSSHVTQGHKEKRYAYDIHEAGRLPNCEARVNWNGEEFEGTDIITPCLELSYKQRFEYWPFLTYSIVQLADLTGSVNGGDFCGFGPGNVLFAGASGSTTFEYEGDIQTDECGNVEEVPTPYWDVTFTFKCQPTRQITVGGQLVTKRGWDYAWQMFDTLENSDAGTRIQVPRGLYITEMYQEKDFCVFGF